MDSGLNPGTWKRSHLLVWALLVILGGIAGMIFGWLVSPFAALAPQTGATTMLAAWLNYPQAY